MAELSKRNSVIKQTSWVSLLANMSLAILKMLAGKIGHSQALFADGLLSLSDAFVDVAAIVGVKYWNKPADSNHPKGHHKLEQVISLLIGAIIAVTGVVLAYDAVVTLVEAKPKTVSVEPITLWVIAVVLLVKSILYVWVSGRAKTWSSTMLLANATDHKIDLLSSVVPLLSILIEYYLPIHHSVDPFATLIVSIFVLYGAWNVIRSASFVLMDGQESQVQLELIETIITQLQLSPIVVSFHYEQEKEQALFSVGLSFPASMTLHQCWDDCRRLKYYLTYHTEPIININTFIVESHDEIVP